MSLISFLEKILPFLFKAARREYDSLPEAEKEALKHGSGVIDIINTEVGKTPAEIRALIIAKFPNLPEAELESGLFELAHVFNLAPELDNFDDVIAKLQTYLSSQSDKKWAAVAQSLANIFAIIIAPEGTVFAKIGMLMEYVYQHFFKKKKGG